MSPELEALALLNKMFDSYDGYLVENALITRKDYAFLVQVLTRKQTYTAPPEEQRREAWDAGVRAARYWGDLTGISEEYAAEREAYINTGRVPQSSGQ